LSIYNKGTCHYSSGHGSGVTGAGSAASSGNLNKT